MTYANGFGIDKADLGEFKEDSDLVRAEKKLGKKWDTSQQHELMPVSTYSIF